MLGGGSSHHPPRRAQLRLPAGTLATAHRGPCCPWEGGLHPETSRDKGRKPRAERTSSHASILTSFPPADAFSHLLQQIELNLLGAWRDAKRSAWRVVVTWAVRLGLAMLLIGIAVRLRLTALIGS